MNHKAGFNVKWLISTPLHLGSGLSAAGLADRVLAKGPQGEPQLRAEAIKGAVRMTAERICQWSSPTKEAEENSLPNYEAIRHIFTPGSGQPRFRWSAGKFTNLPEQTTFRSTSTAILENGLAQEQSLRVFEFWRPGLTVEFSVEAETLDSEDPDHIRDLEFLRQAILLTDGLGGKRMAGAGYLECQGITPISVEKTTPCYSHPDTPPDQAPSQTAPMQWLKLRLTLEEPLTIGEGATVTNEIRTAGHIPATSLRGAYFEELRLAGRASEAGEWFDEGKTEWHAAWPNGFVPMPLCFYQAKRDRGFGGIKGVWNSLSPEPRPAEFVSRVSQPWFDPINLRAKRVPTRLEMHASLHYGAQRSRTGALFSRETIPAGQVFSACVRTGKSLEQWRKISSLVLGKRRSVGGRASLSIEPLGNDSPWGEPTPEDATEAYLQLMTDTLLPGPLGGWLRGLSPSTLQSLLATTAELTVTGFSQFAPVVGWSGKWSLPTESAVAIRAGSCWKITCPDPSALGTWLRKIASQGLGIRRHEGFGRVAVNPPWLKQTLSAPIARVPLAEKAPAPPADSARPWPGFLASERPALAALAVQGIAIAARSSTDALRAVQDLIVTAQRNGEFGLSEAQAALDKQQILRDSWKTLQSELRAAAGVAHDELKVLSGGNSDRLIFLLDTIATEIKSRSWPLPPPTPQKGEPTE